MTRKELTFLMGAGNVMNDANTKISLYDLVAFLKEDTNLSQFLDGDTLDVEGLLGSNHWVSLTVERLCNTKGNKLKSHCRYVKDIFKAVRSLKSKQPQTLAFMLEDRSKSKEPVNELPQSLLVSSDLKKLSDEDGLALIGRYHREKFTIEQFRDLMAKHSDRQNLREFVRAEWPKEDDSATPLVLAYPDVWERFERAVVSGSLDGPGAMLSATNFNKKLFLTVLKKTLTSLKCAPPPWSVAVRQDARAAVLDAAADERAAQVPKVIDNESKVSKTVDDADGDFEEETNKKSKGKAVKVKPEVKKRSFSIIAMPGKSEGAATPATSKTPLAAPDMIPSQVEDLLSFSLLDTSDSTFGMYSNTLFVHDVQPADPVFVPVPPQFFGENSIGLAIIRDPRNCGNVIQAIKLAGHKGSYTTFAVYAKNLEIKKYNIPITGAQLVYFTPTAHGAVDMMGKIASILQANEVDLQVPLLTFLSPGDTPAGIGEVSVATELSVASLSEIFLRSIPRNNEGIMGLVVDLRPGYGTKVLTAMRMAETPAVVCLFSESTHLEDTRDLLQGQLAASFVPSIIGAYADVVRESLTANRVDSNMYLSALPLTSPTKGRSGIKPSKRGDEEKDNASESDSGSGSESEPDSDNDDPASDSQLLSSSAERHLNEDEEEESPSRKKKGTPKKKGVKRKLNLEEKSHSSKKQRLNVKGESKKKDDSKKKHKSPKY